MKPVFDSAKSTYEELRDFMSYINGDNLKQDLDSAAIQFTDTQKSIENLERRYLGAINAMKEEFKIAENDSKYREYLYNRAGLPIPKDVRKYDEETLKMMRKREQEKRE